MSERMTAIIDALRSLPEDAFGYVADTPDQQGWWIRDELIDTACKELDRICGLEAQLARVRGLPKILKLCAEALEIASDWNVEDVQIFPPKTWGLPAHNEDAAEGWCSTFALADRARKVAEELEAALDNPKSDG